MQFHKKRDAVIKLKQSNNPNLRLIQKDKDEFGSKGFYVMTQNDLFDSIKKAQINNKCPNFYESWLDKTNILFSLDIDAPNDIDNIKFNKIISTNITNIIKSAKKFYDYEYQIDNIIVLKTKQQPNKQSAHVIFRGLAFENHLICKNFFFRMIRDKIKLEYCDASIYGLTCLRTCYSIITSSN